MDFPPVGFVRRRPALSDLDTVSRLLLDHWITPEPLPRSPRGSAHLSFEQKGSPNQRAGATGREAMKLLLLLALVVSLRRMLVSGFGFVSCLSRLLLCTHVFVAAVLLRGSPMSLRGLLMKFGGLLVHILKHNIFLAILRAVERNGRGSVSH
jgi:hypothetical protein